MGEPGRLPLDFSRRPFITIWETTRACDLACAHCRASALRSPLPHELTGSEGMALVDQVATMGTPLLVLSGGDPLKRPDLLELIRHGKRRGLRVGTIPAASPRLTTEVVRELQDAGLDQMALSLDFSTPEAHDGFRNAPGAFEQVMAAVGWAHEAGLPVQINSVLSARNIDDLPALIALIQHLDIVFWEVFFLVPVGRGAGLQGLTGDQYEQVFGTLYALERTAPFTVKVTEGFHYRRYQWQQRRREASPHDGLPVRPTVNAGKGHVFISSTGDVYPSGFLPICVGNIREQPLDALYRDAPLLRELRDPARLKGRCGACEYRTICGGSRARAYAMTGDYLAEEPCCAYRPSASGPAGTACA